MISLNKLQLTYLTYLFYTALNNEQMEDKYADLLDCYKDHNFNKVFDHLLQYGLAIQEASPGNWLTAKGRDYVLRYLPFQELWELFRDRIE